MSQHLLHCSNFCGTCNRLRVTADGQLKVCLFGADGLNILHSMRGKLMRLVVLLCGTLLVRPRCMLLEIL
jgi:molybdenum cofactor biosynthesis enzyme MoaA